MRKSILVFCSILLFFTVIIPLIGPTDAIADRLSDAIASAPPGTGKGHIDPKADPGYLGIAGAPDINLIVGLLWAIWVGWMLPFGAYWMWMDNDDLFGGFTMTPVPDAWITALFNLY